MGFWKVILSRIAGRRPSVNQMDHQTIAKNIRTGSLLILREPVDGTKEVIEVTGGPPGTGESHLRAHQIDSADDHPPVAEEKRGKIVATNDATGAIDLIGKDQVGAILDIYAADDPYFPIEHLMVQKPGVSPDTRVTTMLKPRGLLWGGMVSWLDAMWFGVSGAIYYIAGTMLFAPDIKLELDEADPDDPRIDVIVATSNSDFAVITGTPGVNPVKPYVDPVEHVEIAEITVPAGATGFGGSIFREVIYNENIEWTGTGVGLTVDFDSTTLPFFGSKCADAGAFGNNDYIKFVNGSPVTVADYDMMFLALKLKAAANATLTATFYLAGKAISSPAMVRFNASSLAWQQLYLILQEVKFKDTQFDEVRFTWLRIGAGTDPGFYLDYVRLERGISVPPQNTSVILTGDVTGNGVTGSPVQTTLKTVNDNVGEFGSATKVPKITVDAKGRVTAVSEEDITGGGGDSAYVYIAYASDASGTDFTLTFNAVLDYIAILATDTEIPSPAVGDFAGLWKKYKGEPGADGADGANAYLYIAYASDDIGTDFSLSPGASLTYIAALSTDTEIVTPQASDFTGLWRKYVGEDGTPADLTHYCYIAWRDAPGDGFTLTPNLTRAYEAILITHTELTSPVEDDFDGFWRERLTAGTIHQIPAGGTTGQVIKKQSNDDFDIDWEDESGGGQPGGADKQIQFNDGGEFAGDSAMTFDKATKKLSLGNAGSVSLALAGRASGQSAIAENEFVTLSQLNGMINQENDWVRPADWLTLPPVIEGEQKVVGLFAVFDHDSNFIAFLCQGNYTVNWGNGVITNHNSNTVAQNILNYADYAGSECTRGYRQAIITITPQAGQNLYRVNFNKKHTQSGLNAYASGWLDIKMASSELIFLNVGQESAGAVVIQHTRIEQFHFIGTNKMTTASYLFCGCKLLQSIPELYTNLVQQSIAMFYNCYAIKTLPMMNFGSLITASDMFKYARSLITIPLFNFKNVTTLNSIFSNCVSLKYIPLLDWSNVTSATNAFEYCNNLLTIPLLNFEKCTNVSSIFNNCNSLNNIPLLNLSACTNFNNMFWYCTSLLTIPQLDTSKATGVFSMFGNCVSLETVPNLNLSSVTVYGSYQNMFTGCTGLSKISITSYPALNLSVMNCRLSASALVEIFNALPVVGVATTIYITGNWGAALLTAEQRAIATDKGWTIVG